MLLRVLTVLMSFAAIFAQEESLVELRLTIREEKIPSVINYLLDNSLELHDITTRDIIRLSKLDQIEADGLSELLKHYNVIDVYNVDNLEILLKGINITFGEFNRDMTAKLGLSNQQLGQIINDLEIPLTFWQAVAMDSDNIYDILKQGTYDDEHVNAALQTASKTHSEVFRTARDDIAERLQLLSSTAFMELLKTNGWTRTSALSLYDALQLTPEDVYNVETFRNIFVNISRGLNENVTLGVFVGPQKLAVHQSVYDNLNRLVDGVNIQVDAGDNEVSLAQEETLGLNIVGLKVTPGRDTFIEIVEAYNSTEECSYITKVNGGVVSTTVEVEDFTLEKTDRTVFVVGGALVCDGRLYGLARAENDTAIFFDYFYTEDNPEPPQGDFGNGAFLISPFLTFIFIVALL